MPASIRFSHRSAANPVPTMAGPDSQHSPSSGTTTTTTTMVNLAEDAELRLVSILTESDPPLHESCSQQLQQAGQTHTHTQLLQTLIASSVAMNVLMVQLDADEALGALSVLSVLIVRKTTNKTNKTAGLLLTDLAAQIVATGTDTDRKISFLSTLFNVAPDSAAKSSLLATLIDLAAAATSSSSSSNSNSSSYLHPEGPLGRIIYPPTSSSSSFSSSSSSSVVSMIVALGDETARPLLLTKLMRHWTTTERCQVLAAVCRALAHATPHHDATEQALCRQRYLLQYIQEDPTQTGIAEQVAIGAIRDPISLFRLQRHILPTVHAALAVAQPQLYELLTIVQHGTLADYQAYVLKYGTATTLTAWGVDPTQCEVHMRLLTVCSLANNHAAADIPYQEIATAVQQDVSQVESTVIQAIRTGLLQAKMDQLHQTVLVERSVVRKFDLDQWKKLHERLTTEGQRGRHSRHVETPPAPPPASCRRSGLGPINGVEGKHCGTLTAQRHLRFRPGFNGWMNEWMDR
jgi:PCI domain